MRSLGSVVLVALVLVASCKKTDGADAVLTKCTKDADCTYAAKERGDCCVNPCGGVGKAVHVDEAAAISKYNAEYCTETRRKACPQAGACGQPPPGPKGPAKCASGACVGG